MSDPHSRLVYSTDPQRNKKCPHCKNLLEECVCIPVQEWVEKNIKVTMKVETAGRGGKTVSVIEGFPKNETKIKELTKYLKNHCGSGGTYVMGDETSRIEIQGDKRDLIRKALIDQGIKA